jgi:hypothetical protein
MKPVQAGRIRLIRYAALALACVAGAALGADPLIRLNCGGGNAGDGWTSDRDYANGAKVKSPTAIACCRQVPPAVYQTCRVGRKLAYSFPDLPDGLYKIRFHFAEIQGLRRGDRLFKIRVEGVIAVPVMDVADRAAGRNRAVRITVASPVADGNGLQLAAIGLGGDEALLSGIEITPLSGDELEVLPENLPVVGPENLSPFQP